MHTFCPSIKIYKMGGSVWKSFQSVRMFCLPVYNEFLSDFGWYNSIRVDELYLIIFSTVYMEFASNVLLLLFFFLLPLPPFPIQD
jgi:hypothetical protein